MLVPRIVILISLIYEAKQQIHRDSGCSSLHHAQESLCPGRFSRPNSHALQGPSGKRGPPGPKGEKGSTGLTGANGRDGIVDYNRLDELIKDRMKQGLKGYLNNVTKRVRFRLECLLYCVLLPMAKMSRSIIYIVGGRFLLPHNSSSTGSKCPILYYNNTHSELKELRSQNVSAHCMFFCIESIYPINHQN